MVRACVQLWSWTMYTYLHGHSSGLPPLTLEQVVFWFKLYFRYFVVSFSVLAISQLLSVHKNMTLAALQ